MNSDELMDPHLLLIGRPPMGEYLGFLSTQTHEDKSSDYGELAREWRTANDHVRELEELEAGLADNAPIQPVHSSLENLVEQVLADPMYQRSFSIVPTRVGVVELDKLVVFQKHVNLQYVDHLCTVLGNDATDEDVFRFCLGSRHAPAPVTHARVTQNAFVLVSPSTDFRVLDVQLFPASQLLEHRGAGAATGVVGLVVGYGPNYFNVLHCEGRLVLNNGSHRAYTLRKLGITHVPCLIQEISRREELEVIAGGDVAEKPDLYFGTPRPAMFKDFFDSGLCKIVKVRRQLRQMKIDFGVEMLEVPASHDGRRP